MERELMDNHERRARYTHLSDDELADRYRDGTVNRLLTPAQRRRIRHKRGTSAYGRRREALTLTVPDRPVREPTAREKQKLLNVVKGGLRAAGWNVR
jgi:hypothetical protein